MREFPDKRGRMLRVCAVLFLLSGLCVLFYPKLTDWNYRNRVREEKDKFEKIIVSEDKAEDGGRSYEALYEELSRKNEELWEEKQQNLVDAFSYEQTGILLTDYGMESEIFGFLNIPRIDVELPIFFGANSDNLSKGAAQLTETSYPIGGINTNCVLAAHRGYAKTAMFRHIDQLEEGDMIYIHNPWETLQYTVTEMAIIDPSEIDRILIQSGKDMVTLISCHPYGENYQRYVVYCERVQ